MSAHHPYREGEEVVVTFVGVIEKYTGKLIYTSPDGYKRTLPAERIASAVDHYKVGANFTWADVPVGEMFTIVVSQAVGPDVTHLFKRQKDGVFKLSGEPKLVTDADMDRIWGRDIATVVKLVDA